MRSQQIVTDLRVTTSLIRKMGSALSVGKAATSIKVTTWMTNARDMERCTGLTAQCTRASGRKVFNTGKAS